MTDSQIDHSAHSTIDGTKRSKRIPIKQLAAQVSRTSHLADLFSALCSCFRPKQQSTNCEPDDSTSLLPAKPDNAKKTLVLDLDETLVHSSFASLAEADLSFTIDIDGDPCPVSVLKRPGVDEFLAKCSAVFEVVVFTASLKEYADPVLDLLDSKRVIEHRLYRQHCTATSAGLVKDLTRLNRPLKDVLIVDVSDIQNSPVSYRFQPDNAVSIRSWFSNKNDQELEKTWSVLAELSKANNVSTVIRQAKQRCRGLTHLAVLRALANEAEPRAGFNSPNGVPSTGFVFSEQA